MDRRILFIVACLSSAAAACAASTRHPAPDVGVASMQARDTAHGTPGAGPPQIDPRTTQAVEALVAHDYAKVLALTQSAESSEASASPWLEYDRASALAGLDRTDAAIEAFTKAASRFRQARDDAGVARALWGKAHTLDEAGRCAEARQAYAQYESFVGPKGLGDAERAARYAGTCRLHLSVR